MSSQEFYDSLANYYHLIYDDWEKDFTHQAKVLRRVISKYWGNNINSILDASCGIGTQSIGLAQLGYSIIGADLSQKAIDRAVIEANIRDVNIKFIQLDMREISPSCFSNLFDLVLACDNSIPHLLSENEISIVFNNFLSILNPGGGVIISVRDYAKIRKSGIHIVPRKVHIFNEKKIILFDVWEFHGDFYDMNTYVVEDFGTNICNTQVFRTEYYCVEIPKLEALLAKTGFTNIKTIRGVYFQPLLIGKKPGNYVAINNTRDMKNAN
jgi:SAM-dependent methyltransferase